MSQRKAVITQTARRYRAATWSKKTASLDELCATTGCHCAHARKALRLALRPQQPPEEA